MSLLSAGGERENGWCHGADLSHSLPACPLSEASDWLPEEGGGQTTVLCFCRVSGLYMPGALACFLLPWSMTLEAFCTKQHRCRIIKIGAKRNPAQSGRSAPPSR